MPSPRPINWYPPVILLLVALLVLVFSLLVIEKAGERGGLSVSGEETSQTRYRWSLVTTWPKNFPVLGTSVETFSRQVEVMSAGRLVIHVYGANEIVPANGVFDAVSAGSVEMGHAASYYWRGKVPAAQFFTTIPFGMNAQESNGWLFHGGGLDLWREVYAPFNLVPYPGGNTGVQMAGWFNRDINSVNDLRGLKMRIPGMAGEIFNRAGGSAVNIPGGELYTALQTGVIDAAEWVGPVNDLAFGFPQIARNYYYPGWQEPGSTLEFLINTQAWASLPKDLQAIVEGAMRTMNQDMLDQFTAHNMTALQQIQERGVTLRRFPDDVIQRFYDISQQVYAQQAAADPVFKKVYESYNDFQTRIRAYNDITELDYFKVRDAVDPK
jgi:TRAP-type mannitol/chloroaromatic compound transport system substrate-binding protein